MVLRVSQRVVLAVLFAALLPACKSGGDRPAAAPDLPGLDPLSAGWNALAPGGETICSNGSPYSFFVRPGDPQKLLIYLQGGGACWFGEICDLKARPAYDPSVDPEDNPAASPAGIFDLDNPENPFRDYSMVFVPYCTADVHLGDRVTTYEVPATDSTEAHQVTIHHRGYVNATTVLEWTFARFEEPETVFVTGSSAGAIPSPLYADLVAERYPGARIAQLGDAAGGYRSREVGSLAATNWGTLDVLPDYPEYAGITADNLTFEALYEAAARRHPGISFAQYNTAEDDVQRFFLSLTGVQDVPLLPLIEANYADIEQAVPNFRAYTAGGTEHTILGRPEFYTYQVDGVRFRDWVADLAGGAEVADVKCRACARVEVYASE